MDEQAAYGLGLLGDGRQRPGRRRAGRHEPQFVRRSESQSGRRRSRRRRRRGRRNGDTAQQPDLVRAVQASGLRTPLDGRVHLEHRHLDGVDRARHLRDQAHQSGRVDRNGRRRGLPADRVPQPDRWCARRSLFAALAHDRHEPVPDRAGRGCSPCCSWSATRRRRSSPSSRSATASRLHSGSRRFRPCSPISCRSRTFPARSRCRRRNTTSAASSVPRSPAS